MSFEVPVQRASYAERRAWGEERREGTDLFLHIACMLYIRIPYDEQCNLHKRQDSLQLRRLRSEPVNDFETLAVAIY
jgi:hypothetical protein